MFRLNHTLFGKGMFFARTNGNHSSGAQNAHGLPNRNSHNARHSNRPLVSRARQKHRPIGSPNVWVAYARARVRGRGKAERQRPLQMIERNARRITIRRGGSHGQTQRLERSLRSRSTFCRHVALFCVDLLYAQRCAFLDLV